MAKKKVVVETAAGGPTEKTEGGVVNDVLGGERESLYDQYAQMQAAEGEVKPDAEPAEKPAKEPEPKVEDYHPAASTASEPPEAKDAPPEESKSKTTVPYDALHAEREKRKAAQSKIRELETQLASLKKPLEAQKQIADGPIEDYETEIKSLKQTVFELQGELKNHQTQIQKREQDETMKTLASQISRTTAELRQEGFPLFDAMQHKVGAEIFRLVEEADDDEKDLIIRKWDNPNGWKAIYKERVFPEIAKELNVRQKTETGEQKKDLKRQAQLTGSPGSRPSEETEEKEWTAADYFAERRKYNISGMTSLGG